MKIKEKIWRELCDSCEGCGNKLSIFEKEVIDDYRKRDKRFSLEERKKILCFRCLNKKIELKIKKRIEIEKW